MKIWKTWAVVQDNAAKLDLSEVSSPESGYDSSFSCLSGLSVEDIDTLVLRLQQERALLVKLNEAIK